jgi:hypothetical protein
MADHTIAAEAEGVYELALAANTVTTVDIEFSAYYDVAQVMVHAGTSPVYIKTANTVSPREPGALMCPPLMFVAVKLGRRNHRTLALISEADAIVSVYRA